MNIEFILKESTLDDILGPWSRSGREYDTSKGGFSFENASGYEIKGGFIEIGMEEDRVYIYNMSDFYRIKISYPD